MTSIQSWLEAIGLGKYVALFVENEIDVDVLPELDEADLKELEIPLGARKKILKAVRSLEPGQARSLPGSRPGGTAPPVAGEAERRQLTVMFCDLVGSTSLSESMDPEDYRDLLGAYQSVAAAQIQAHEGYIARYMGDGLLVYFGYPVAHENDAERAVLSGLALIEAVAGLDAPVRLRVRVGIATGPVLVGDIVGEGASEEAAVLGETPNLAARLQGAAIPNTVLLSPTTQQLLSGRVDTEPLEPVVLRGLSRAVVPYRALRARSLSEVSEARRDTGPLVGRDIELALLKRAWRKAQESEGQLILLSGEAGVGKSRLLRAFRESLGAAERIQIAWHCSPYYQATANHPAIEQLKRLLVAKDPGGERSLDVLAELVEGLELESSALVPLLATLLSMPLDDRYMAPDCSPDELKRRIIAAQVDLLIASARRTPVIFLVEDLHWADPTTIEVLDEMLGVIRGRRVLILGTARPEFRPPWVERPHAVTQPLTNLSRSEAMALARGIASARGLSSEVLEQIVERTDGVPLFVEELTKSLVDFGVTDGVPASLQDSLRARLDRLGAAKELAQMASVVGREFSVDALAAMAGRARDRVDSQLAELVDSGLVIRRLGGRYEFKHALIRDAAYESMLRALRRDYHKRYAACLADQGGDVAPPELLAQHHDGAEMPLEALEQWARAGQQARERAAYSEAQSHFSSALEKVVAITDADERDRTELDLQLALGAVAMAHHGYASRAAAKAYEHAREISERLSDTDTLFRVVLGWRYVRHVSGYAREALELAERCQAIAEQERQPVWLVQSNVSLAHLSCVMGEFKKAQHYCELGEADYVPEQQAAYQTHATLDPGVLGLAVHSWVKWFLGYPDQADELSCRAITLAQSLDQLASLEHASGSRCTTLILRREPEAVRAQVDASLALAAKGSMAMRINQNRLMGAWANSFAAVTGDPVAEMENALGQFQATGARTFSSYFLTLMADALVRDARYAAALERIDEALRVASEIEEHWWEAEALRLRGEALRAIGEESAEAAFRKSLEVAIRQGARSWQLRTSVSLARLLQDKRDTAGALDTLDEAMAGFTEGFETPDMLQAQSMVEALR